MRYAGSKVKANSCVILGRVQNSRRLRLLCRGPAFVVAISAGGLSQKPRVVRITARQGRQEHRTLLRMVVRGDDWLTAQPYFVLPDRHARLFASIREGYVVAAGTRGNV